MGVKAATATTRRLRAGRRQDSAIDAKLAAYAKDLCSIQKLQKSDNKLLQGTASREQLKQRRAKLQSERKALWKA